MPPRSASIQIVDLLPAQPGLFIEGDDLIEELPRQVGLVGVGGIGRLDGGRLGEDASQDRDAARRCRDQGLGIGAGPQRQHRQVPGRFGALPAGQLVGPQGVDVQSAGALGLLAAQADRAGAVGPGDAALRRLESRPAPWRRHGEQPRGALDHDVADVGGGRGDQAAELHDAGLDAVLDPAGAGPRLARPAPGHVRPDPPVARGGPLARPGSGMRAALAGRQAARARFGVPIPGRAIGHRGRDRTRVGLNPGNPHFGLRHSVHGPAPPVWQCAVPARRSASRRSRRTRWIGVPSAGRTRTWHARRACRSLPPPSRHAGTTGQRPRRGQSGEWPRPRREPHARRPNVVPCARPRRSRTPTRRRVCPPPWRK